MATSAKNTLLIYIIVILVILAVNLIGGYVISQKILNYTYSSDNLDTLTESKSEEEKGAVQDTGPPGTSVPLDPVNLNPAGSSGEIFSCKIVLEVKDQLVIDELKSQLRKDQIMDRISSYLSLKTVQELGDAEMWDKYRKEMTDLVNSVLTDGKINNLYITEKIIQFP